MQIDPFLSPCTKLKSKWIKELHIKPDMLKLIEEKVGKSLKDMGTGQVTVDAGEDVEKEKHSSTAGGIASLYTDSGRQSGVFSGN